MYIDAFKELISVLPVEAIDKISDLVLILKALSIVAIIYFVYLLVNGFFSYKRMKKVAFINERTIKIEKKINSIDKKLSKLLKKN